MNNVAESPLAQFLPLSWKVRRWRKGSLALVHELGFPTASLGRLKMSFTLHLMPAQGNIFDFLRVREAFGEFLSEHPTGIGYLLQYDAENESMVDIQKTEEGGVDCVSVNGPCADDRLFVALHKALTSVPSFMTYPDENVPCLVATEEAATAVREHHPELEEGLKVCQTPAELIADW